MEINKKEIESHIKYLIDSVKENKTNENNK